MESKHIPVSGKGAIPTNAVGTPKKSPPKKADGGFAKVFYKLREKYGLSVSDYCVLYCIHKDTATKNAVSKRSNKELAEILGEHRNTVRNGIERLLGKGLIEKSSKGMTVAKEVKTELREGNGYFSVIDFDLKKNLGLGWNECYLLWSLFLLEKSKGVAFPGTEHLCNTLFMADRTVKEALKVLEAKGMIERAQKFQHGTKRRFIKVAPGVRVLLAESENKYAKGRKAVVKGQG
jgi:DNA-binding MarR family transcriptional regulator